MLASEKSNPVLRSRNCIDYWFTVLCSSCPPHTCYSCTGTPLCWLQLQTSRVRLRGQTSTITAKYTLQQLPTSWLILVSVFFCMKIKYQIPFSRSGPEELTPAQLLNNFCILNAKNTPALYLIPFSMNPAHTLTTHT